MKIGDKIRIGVSTSEFYFCGYYLLDRLDTFEVKAQYSHVQNPRIYLDTGLSRLEYVHENR